MNKFAKLKNEKGLLTIEASVIMPVFLVLILTILSFINIITTQMRVQTALDASAKEISQSAHINNLAVGQGVLNIMKDWEEIEALFSGSDQGDASGSENEDIITDENLYGQLFKDQDNTIRLLARAERYLITSHKSDSENSLQVGESLAKVLILKHLTNQVINDKNLRENNVDQNLKKGGVENGLAGLDFSGSKAFIAEGKPQRTQIPVESLSLLKSRISGNINNQWMTFLVMHDNGITTENPSCTQNSGTGASSNAEKCLKKIDGVTAASCSLTSPHAAIHADCSGTTIPQGKDQCVWYVSAPSYWKCGFSDSNFFWRDQSKVNSFVSSTIDKFTTHAPQDERLVCEGGKIKSVGNLRGTNAELTFINMVLHSNYHSQNTQGHEIDWHGNVGQSTFALDGILKSDKTPQKYVDDSLCPADNNVKIDNTIDFRVKYQISPFSFFGLKFSFPVSARAVTNAWSDPIVTE